MQRDIRQTPPFIEAQHLYQDIWPAHSQRIVEAQQLNTSPDGRSAVFSGTCGNGVGRPAAQRIFHIDLQSGFLSALTPNSCPEKRPMHSPCGKHIAFLSDRDGGGNFQLTLLNLSKNLISKAPAVAGWVEELSWSPDGGSILLTVAGHGADQGSGQGAVPSKQYNEQQPECVPEVSAGDEDYRWRHLWVYDIATRKLRKIPTQDINVWEAVWCGNNNIAAITSDQPGEEAWYSATLKHIHPRTGKAQNLFTPSDQIAYLCATPSGQSLALVSAISSDRGVVAGDLITIDINTQTARQVSSNHVDITSVEWLSETRLLSAGQRGFDTVILDHRLTDRSNSESVRELWQSSEISGAGHYIKVCSLRAGDCLFIAEGFKRAPEIGRISSGLYHPVKSFDQGYQQQAEAIHKVEQITWQAADGLDIQGWLLLPKGSAPHPLVMDMHGGPVWQWQPHWLGRRLHILMLLRHGYAVFMPNPRGSAGRGQDYCRKVLGDLGGADSQDCLSGLDYLVDQGLADPSKIGLIGHSYGGYLGAWLISQDQRFASAVISAPMINYVSQHLLSNISHYVELFLQDHYKNLDGKYLQRSPITYAHQVTTPTLSLCGALDRCTPAAEATQFHNALLENGVKTVLVNYPLEGHGIKGIPAMLDYSARIYTWLAEHMPAVGSYQKLTAAPEQAAKRFDQRQAIRTSKALDEPKAVVD